LGNYSNLLLVLVTRTLSPLFSCLLFSSLVLSSLLLSEKGGEECDEM